MPAISVEYEYRVHDGTTALATFFAGSGGALLVASSVAGGTFDAEALEHTITAPAGGVVKAFCYAAGEQVSDGAPLVEFDLGA